MTFHLMLSQLVRLLELQGGEQTYRRHLLES